MVLVTEQADRVTHSTEAHTKCPRMVQDSSHGLLHGDRVSDAFAFIILINEYRPKSQSVLSRTILMKDVVESKGEKS